MRKKKCTVENSVLTKILNCCKQLALIAARNNRNNLYSSHRYFLDITVRLDASVLVRLRSFERPISGVGVN